MSAEGVVMRENKHGVEKPHVQVPIGGTVVEVPARITNPITDRCHDLRNLSDDGYLKPFLATLSHFRNQNTIDPSSSPVLTFDKDRFEYRELDGSHVLIKRDAETRLGERVLDADAAADRAEEAER